MSAVLKEFKNGCIITPKYEREKRMLMCDFCLSRRGLIFRRCGLCGCFIRLKILFPEEKCPLDFWKEVDYK